MNTKQNILLLQPPTPIKNVDENYIKQLYSWNLSILGVLKQLVSDSYNDISDSNSEIDTLQTDVATLQAAGYVVGPATNTANYLPQWNGANSKLLKDGLMLDTDGALTANSDTRIPSQQAIVEYAAPITTTALKATTPVILDSSVKSTTVGSTASETTLYTFSVPANTLGTANALRLTIFGTWQQNNNQSCIFRLKYGATTLATTDNDNKPDSATVYNFIIEAFLVAQGATNSQFGSIYFKSGKKDGPFYGMQGISAQDSTGALTLLITAQWSGAHAQVTLTSKYAILEKILGV